MVVAVQILKLVQNGNEVDSLKFCKEQNLLWSSKYFMNEIYFCIKVI